MARGFGARESVGKYTDVYRGMTAGEKKAYSDAFAVALEKSVAKEDQPAAWDFYKEQFELARDGLAEFGDSLAAAKEALANPNFDWQDTNNVAKIVPLPAEDYHQEVDAYEYMDTRFEDDAHSDPAFDDAATKDREYEDDEGEPASLRGNSEVDFLRGEWAKDVIKELISREEELRKGYLDEMNPETIIRKFNGK